MNGKDDPSLTPERQEVPTQAIRAAHRDRAPEPASYPFLLPPVESDEIGRLGNYRILRLLGKGGMGIVFQAEDIALRRRVALKVMKQDEEGSLSLQRFLREARAMAAIKHDNLVTVFQVGQEGDTYYLAMELLEGETLDHWLTRTDEIEVADIFRVGAEIAKGLAAIHQHGLVHRDIKPTNLWLESRGQGTGIKNQGTGIRSQASVESTHGAIPLIPDTIPLPPVRVKILDFGLARTAQDETHITQTGTIIGTPAFMSPEQARGQPADHRSDLFSLGSVLYCLCTKRAPFQAQTTLAQLAALVADEPDPVRKVNPRIPQALSELVMELLAKNPDKRPQSAEAVAERLLKIKRTLNKAREKSDTDATQKVPRRRSAKDKSEEQASFWERHRTKLLIAGPIFLAAIALLAIFTLPGSKPENANPLANGGVKKAPDAAKTFLSDLKPASAVNWPFAKPKPAKPGKKPPPPEFFENKVIVKNQPSLHGIFMHAAHPHEQPASLTYQLDKNYKTFSAEVTLNDTSPGCSPMTCSVYGDGKLLWKSQPIVDQKPPQKCSVSVDNVVTLKLEVTCAGDIGGAHAVWIEPYLAR